MCVCVLYTLVEGLLPIIYAHAHAYTHSRIESSGKEKGGGVGVWSSTERTEAGQDSLSLSLSLLIITKLSRKERERESQKQQQHSPTDGPERRTGAIVYKERAKVKQCMAVRKKPVGNSQATSMLSMSLPCCCCCCRLCLCVCVCAVRVSTPLDLYQPRVPLQRAPLACLPASLPPCLLASRTSSQRVFGVRGKLAFIVA